MKYKKTFIRFFVIANVKRLASKKAMFARTLNAQFLYEQNTFY